MSLSPDWHLYTSSHPHPLRLTQVLQFTTGTSSIANAQCVQCTLFSTLSAWLSKLEYIQIPTEDFTDETLAIDYTMGDDVRGDGDWSAGHEG